ncbi:MAG TPA: hypothetical protein VLX91_11675 [Candidatus Acidoferrales bacterium]|nr:hypothetical protein [Candidatus Acidoferrales bacterium]
MSVKKMRKCPDCLSVVKLHKDYPSSFWESLLKSLRIIKVNRCPNCNAAIFVVLGLYATSRKRLRIIRERAFWLLFVAMILAVGYIAFVAMMG